MKKFYVFIFSFIIAVSFASMSFAEEKETDQADKIKQAQEGLTTLGFYKGEATGKMNPDTREAIKKFKEKEMDKKMASGALDEKTCDLISKKVDEKKKKDAEDQKSPMDKAKKKLDEGKSKMMPGAEMPK